MTAKAPSSTSLLQKVQDAGGRVVREIEAAMEGVWLSKQDSSHCLSRLQEKLIDWIGMDAQIIKNEAGDIIFLSKDGTKKVRFDFHHPAPHRNPHGAY